MKKHLNFILFIVTLFNIYGQDKNPEKEIRSVSIFSSMGALQFIALGGSYQINEKYSIGLISSIYILGHTNTSEDATYGIGFRGSYYFSTNGYGKILWANNLNCDVEYLLSKKPYMRKKHIEKLGGIGIELTVGSDRILNKGFGINWACGISMSVHGEAKFIIAPALRLGWHIDL